MKTLYGMSFKECVQDYVSCLDKPPNGHGQNYSERAGCMPSHYWLGEIYKSFGKDETQKEIDRLFAKQEILKETYRPWVKKLGQWHLADDNGKTRCGVPMLGNNYASDIHEYQRTKCTKCFK